MRKKQRWGVLFLVMLSCGFVIAEIPRMLEFSIEGTRLLLDPSTPRRTSTPEPKSMQLTVCASSSIALTVLGRVLVWSSDSAKHQIRYRLLGDGRRQDMVIFRLTAPDSDRGEMCQGATLKVVLPRPAEVIDLAGAGHKSAMRLWADSVFIPEGFSPNNDGVNDRFEITVAPTITVTFLEVFNRWGHAVYRSTEYKNDWDGTANQGVRLAGKNTTLPDGTYFCIVRLSNGREYIRLLTLNR